jgi:hypothetical protein
LVAEGRYNAVVVTAEQGQAFPDDTGAAELAMLDGWRADAVLLPAELQSPPWPQAQPGARAACLACVGNGVATPAGAVY